MFAFPFLASKRPASLRAYAERLSGVWGLGYNIAHEDERTALLGVFLAAFYHGAREPLAMGLAGIPGEEGE
jgi:hypothetical protein